LVLPKRLLDSCGFGAKATVTVQNKTLIATPLPRKPCDGWAEAIAAIPEEALARDFKEFAAFRETRDEWDSAEWQWPDAPDEKV
jgi:hypothetical protein